MMRRQDVSFSGQKRSKYESSTTTISSWMRVMCNQTSNSFFFSCATFFYLCIRHTWVDANVDHRQFTTLFFWGGGGGQGTPTTSRSYSCAVSSIIECWLLRHVPTELWVSGSTDISRWFLIFIVLVGSSRSVDLGQPEKLWSQWSRTLYHQTRFKSVHRSTKFETACKVTRCSSCQTEKVLYGPCCTCVIAVST